MSELRAAGTAEWLEFVRQEYPLADVTLVRDLGGNYNLNLQVSTDRGALVVRVSPEWVKADRLAAVQAVRGYLRGLGWPIPQTVRTHRSGHFGPGFGTGRWKRPAVPVEQVDPSDLVA
ncbi:MULTISPECIES: phosphotransferase [Kribbella]|uniref:phosphotransferase n=1 Tax=Kribbella TaxID=182639 RepID=UPI00104AD3D2|nr:MULTISPECIES: phosphotransferase [Kribbella]